MKAIQHLTVVVSSLLLQCLVPVSATSIDLGTFQNPSASSRPRFRYWVPDASVNLSTIRDDIADAGKVGAGGVELLGYYNYGDVEGGAGVIPTDWATYGWGTPAWKQLQDVALQSTKDNRLIIDLSLGPNQGAGVPAPVDADGLQWDLQPFNASVPLGGRFDAILPGWSSGQLVSASTALLKGTANVSSVMTDTLSATSLQDVTSQVSKDGHLDITFPSNAQGQHFLVFAYYLIHTQYREQQTPELVISGDGITQSLVANFVQNGSWVVDHFSAQGARQVAEFWKSHLLNGGNTERLIREVGHYVWEDSQEFPSNILWTKNAPTAFQTQHGYSINKYLPILMHGNGGGICFADCAPEIAVVTDEVDGGAKHVADFRQTMTELNKQYLDGITAFAKSLGVQSSAQVAYNFPLDMLSDIPHIDAPETETLGFNHLIDGYRQYSGPANLAGRRVISSEAGAIYGSAFQQTIPELLWDLKRSIVGGVNAFVLHGMPFSGYYPNTTWPGYVTFTYLFSEMHNRHQPGWEYYRDFIDYTARVQHVMQAGEAKVDLAFWLKQTTYTSISRQYQPTDLEQAGYTYEYISPDDFTLAAANVQDGVLAPTEQAFKALLIRANDTLTVAGVSKLSQWAHEGLPIFLSGGLPSNVSGTVSSADLLSINTTLAQISRLRNVHVVPYDGLAKSLASLGIQPRSSISTSVSGWYTRWRESAEEITVFVYYDATGLPMDSPVSNGTITFDHSGTPYLYEAWTGEQTPLPQCTQAKGSTTIPLSLAGNQSTIIAFKKARRSQGHRQPYGSMPKLSTPTTLGNWSLMIESWSAPNDIFDIEGTVKRNTTYNIDALRPWSKLNVGTNLTYVSGRGYYRTSFSWPLAHQKAKGAILTMGPIVHTAVLYVNGHRVPPLDVTAPKADVSKYLRDGVNSVEIVVSTPLGNALIPVEDKLRTVGARGAELGTASFSVKEYGLVGEVVLTPYD